MACWMSSSVLPPDCPGMKLQKTVPTSEGWEAVAIENLYSMAQDFSIIAKQQLQASRSSWAEESAKNITELET